MPVVHAVALTRLALASGGPPAGFHELAATFGTAPPGSTAITTIMNWLKWIGGAVSVGAITVLGITMMVLHHQPGGGSLSGRAGKVFGGIIVLSSATALSAAVLH
jgi:hypothetical protein